GRWAGEAVEQRLADDAVVRLPVDGRDTAFVDPPELDAAPNRTQDAGALVRRSGPGAAGHADVPTRSCRPGDQLGGGLRCLLGALGGAEVDRAQPPSSASSCERSIAAWIAFRNAARTPAASSSRLARILVPHGAVTGTRSSTGWTRSSRRSFAVPSIVWTTSWVVTSRESPSRSP